MTEVPTFLALSLAPQNESREQQSASRAIGIVRTHARAEPHVVRHGTLLIVTSDDSMRVRTEGGDIYRLSRPPGPAAVADSRFPPFAQASLAPGEQSVRVVVDSCGLRHLYWVQSDHWAAVSTSSTVLAAVAQAPLDEAALAALALCGNLLDASTPFRSIRKMPADSTGALTSGHFTVEATERPMTERGRPTRLRRPALSVQEGTRAILTSVQETLADHSEVLLELSGGLDSRMLLGALRGHESKVRTVTLDYPGGSEARVASRLAAMAGLDHRVLDMTGLQRLNADDVGALVAAASHRRDHSGNPLAGAVLDWVEAQLDQGPRLTGQNGEYCRGFYYPMQRQHGATTPRAARRLAKWRMLTNEGVDPSIFHLDFIEEARARTIEQIAAILTGYQMPWLDATDEFYLRERMQRWVGLGFSDACMSRPLLAPFFHPEFLRWSAAADPADKRNSRLFAMVLQDLSPELAGVPLSDRPAPATLAASELTSQLRQLGTTTSKAVGKLRQKVSRAGKPAEGTARLASMQQEHWSRRPDLLDAVATLPFMDTSLVEEVAHGRVSLSPASVGFLATLQGLCNVTAATHTSTL